MDLRVHGAQAAGRPLLSAQGSAKVMVSTQITSGVACLDGGVELVDTYHSGTDETDEDMRELLTRADPDQQVVLQQR